MTSNEFRRFQIFCGTFLAITGSYWNRLYYEKMFAFTTTEALQNLTPTTIKVCQNKHCCKRASNNINILQTMNNLLLTSPQSQLLIESNSCLSHCDMGPNVEILLPNGTSLLLHGMSDAQMCAAQLGLLMLKDEAKEQDDEILKILSPPKILLAASKVMEQSQILPMEERIRYLTSVITKLEESNQQTTAVMAHAYALRAQAYLDQQNDNSNVNSNGNNSLDYAIQDAQYVVRQLQHIAAATPITLASAYRTLVDAELLHGRTQLAIAVLQEWYHVQPIYRTKLQRELQELITRSGA
jgi:hypothetical protein